MQPTRESTSLPHEMHPAAPENYDAGRPAGHKIDKIIIHTEVGFKAGTEAQFANPQAHVSAHYGVDQDGSLDQFVKETDTAWQAGNLFVNQESIGIEHEDMDRPNDPRPDALYATSGKLVYDICTFYDIPIDRDHILKHLEVSQLGTSCPDTLDIERIVAIAQSHTAVNQPQATASTQPATEIAWTTLQDKYDAADHRFLDIGTELGIAGNNNRDQMKADIIQAIKGLKDVATSVNKTDIDLTTKVGELTDDNKKLILENQSLNGQLESVLHNYQLKATEDHATADIASKYMDSWKASKKTVEVVASIVRAKRAVETDILAAIDAMKASYEEKIKQLKNQPQKPKEEVTPAPQQPQDTKPTSSKWSWLGL
jgi:N-acetyl-anhydromuramyl-L-alanine amidase AmpD